MKEVPILFSGEMVRAIIAGKKTMTRRTTGLHRVNKSPDKVQFIRMQEYPDGTYRAIFQHDDADAPGSIKSPYGKTGDVLWVRESWNVEQIPAPPEGDRDQLLYYYKATEKQYVDMKWKPSIHMPKVISRTWMLVTNINVERLQDVSDEDAIAEGVERIGDPAKGGFKDYVAEGKSPWMCARNSFFTLWQSINGEDSLCENPWVWAVSFKVLSTTGKPKQ
jgi:hypothetical protein